MRVDVEGQSGVGCAFEWPGLVSRLFGTALMA